MSSYELRGYLQNPLEKLLLINKQFDSLATAHAWKVDAFSATEPTLQQVKLRSCSLIQTIRYKGQLKCQIILQERRRADL